MLNQFIETPFLRFTYFRNMAGIYIHIPFCKQACHYCDFHFSTSLKYKDEMLEAILKELKIRKNYLQSQKIETIYFGGGTPSLLNAQEISKFIDLIDRNFELISHSEITLEANPDDLNPQQLKALRSTAINRLSIGVQSFFDEDLKWMNRAHQAQEAESSIKRAQDLGLENITIDLIYGFPLLSDEKWQQNISKAVAFEIPHISSYSMTVEPRTALASKIKKGEQKNMDDAQSASQFQILMNTLTQNGFEHYEISNFAKPNQYAWHNTNYWKGVHYLGIGPSAHSFNGFSRQWNVANNAKYLSALSQNDIPFEVEKLSKANQFNEYVMTSLRTMWGIDLLKLKSDFDVDFEKQFSKNLEQFIVKDWILKKEQSLILTTKGKLYADHIASELFISEDEF